MDFYCKLVCCPVCVCVCVCMCCRLAFVKFFTIFHTVGYNCCPAITARVPARVYVCLYVFNSVKVFTYLPCYNRPPPLPVCLMYVCFRWCEGMYVPSLSQLASITAGMSVCFFQLLRMFACCLLQLSPITACISCVFPIVSGYSRTLPVTTSLRHCQYVILMHVWFFRLLRMFACSPCYN